MKKIVLIEDHPQMRRNLAFILQMEGYQPIPAENGHLGLAAIREHNPDLVLCDVMLPEMDGYSVLNTLRADPEKTTLPFIFLTAKGDKLDIRQGMNLGADDYLTKPVAKADLLATIRVRLARHQVYQNELQTAKASVGFNPDYSSHKPLLTLGITEREAQVLLWVAQGKSNADVAVILEMAEKTVKKHMSNLFAKLGVESRNAATLRALEALGTPRT